MHQSPLMRARQLVHALALAQGAFRPGRAPVLLLLPCGLSCSPAREPHTGGVGRMGVAVIHLWWGRC